MTTQPQQYWHFLRGDGRLRFIPYTRVVPGQTLRVEGAPVVGSWGFHACAHVADAVALIAPELDGTGDIIVQCCTLGGEISKKGYLCSETGYIYAAQERTCLWMAPATRALHEAGCDVAEAVLDRVEPLGVVLANGRGRAAVEMKRAWLRGLASTDDLVWSRRGTGDLAWLGDTSGRRSILGCLDWAGRAGTLAELDARDAIARRIEALAPTGALAPAQAVLV